jgi:3-phenylpropionate/trans-cinnamate dioxygenase ferredoxin reductase subunit
LLLSTGVNGLTGSGRVDGVLLGNGETLDTDMVVIGIGIVPNMELAINAGLDVGNGVIVDDHCRTSDPNLYAIGDCSFHPNRVLDTYLRLESVHNALEQAKTAAANICGEDTAYSQVPWFWSDQYDLKLQIAGISQGYDDVVMRGDPTSKSFSCLYLRGGKLIAVDAVNAPRDYVHSKALIANHARIDPAVLANTTIQLKDAS